MLIIRDWRHETLLFQEILRNSCQLRNYNNDNDYDEDGEDNDDSGEEKERRRKGRNANKSIGKILN